jgi:CRP/FNR family transcriptional regulator, nitrogen fixation regulation protein
MGGQLAYNSDRASSAHAIRFVPEDREISFGPAGAVVSFSQDREIYAEGAAANAFYKVVSGVVRTCKFLSDGRRQIDAFYRPGEVFGIESDASHSLSAEAVSDCTLVSFRRRGVDIAKTGGMGVDQLFDHLMRRVTQTQEHALLLGRRSALEKVAAFLVDWGNYSSDHKVVSLAMTRQDMADYLGLTIETVSRTLSQLERDGLIEMPTARQIRLTGLQALRDLNA